MKKHTLVAGVGIIALAGGLIGCSTGTPVGGDNEVTLTLDYYTNGSHPFITEGVQRFIEEVTEKSDGSINFKVYPAAQLGPSQDALNRLKTGIADLSMIYQGYFPEELPLNQAVFLPMGVDPAVASYAQWRLVTEGGPVRDEWLAADALPLIISATEATELQSTSDNISSLDAAHGLQVRTSSDAQVALTTELGMSAVSISTSEMYESLQRGVVDATFYLFGSWPSLNLDELITNSTLNLNLTVGSQALAINPDIFASLSEQQQRILVDAGRNASISSFTALTEAGKNVREEFLKNSANTGIEWSQADLVRVKQASEKVVDRWVTAGASAGLETQATIDRIRSLIKDAGEAGSVAELPTYQAQGIASFKAAGLLAISEWMWVA